MDINIKKNEGISQAIKRKLVEQGAKESSFNSSIWSNIQKTFVNEGSNEKSTIKYLQGGEENIGDLWTKLNMKISTIVDDVISISENTWTKLLSLVGITKVTGNNEDPSSVNPDEEEPSEEPSDAQEPEHPTEDPDKPDATTGKGSYKKTGKAINESNTADGVIDSVNQGNVGDCWLLSGLNSLNETSWGRQAIKNAISIKDNGDIEITLKGACGKKKKFLISKQELESAKQNDKYSKGDMDVLAIELAVEKYRKQFGQTLDAGFEEETFRLITGSHNTKIITNKKNMKAIMQKVKQNPDNYAISVGVNLGGKYGRDSNHAYNVSRFETDANGTKYVILTNPWDSKSEIKITESEFLSRVYQMELLANPNPANKRTAKANADGKISNTTSADKGDDINIASGIYAVLNSNPDALNDCISKDSRGNVVVKLKGINKSYTITAKDISKARESGHYTKGDDDVIALEIAMERAGLEEFGYNTLESEGLGIGVKANTTVYSISSSRAIYLLTGESGKYANSDANGNYYVSNTPESPSSTIDPDLLKGFQVT